MSSKQNERPCTCHPDDSPPNPCQKMYAMGECEQAARAAPPSEPVPEIVEELRGLLWECWHAWNGTGPAIALDRIHVALTKPVAAPPDLAAEIERLTAENFSLAAHQCLFTDGSGLTGDEYGHQYCAKQKEVEGLKKYAEEMRQDVLTRNGVIEQLTDGTQHLSDRLGQYIKDVLRLTAERDALRALLKEARGNLGGDMINPIELLARIDAALKEKP